MKITDDLVGDWPRWSLRRIRQRIVHSEVFWAAFVGTATWLIAIAFSVACWLALVFFLSL